MPHGGTLARSSDPPEEIHDDAGADQDAEERSEVAAQRTKFFGYLALLSGGAILLSVSLVSAMLGKGALGAVAVLFAGWIALLIALFGSIFRMLKYQPPPLKARATHSSKVPMVKPLALSHRAGDPFPDEIDDSVTGLDEDAEEEERIAGQHLRQTRTAEALAIHGFWIGAVLLVIFTGTNVVGANRTQAQAQPAAAMPVIQESGGRLFAPPDVSEGSGRAASCAEAERVATACTKSGIDTEEVEPFASKGGYQIPLPLIANVPRGFRADPNPKDCDTAEQWQNYCRQHP